MMKEKRRITMENRADSTFTYEYSAEATKQAEAILRRYVPQEKDALTKMKELDARVNKRATGPAIGVGILGALVLGGGMSLVMEVGGIFFGIGIAIGIIGLAICGLAFPFYQKKLQKERTKVADEIVKLSKEI